MCLFISFLLLLLLIVFPVHFTLFANFIPYTVCSINTLHRAKIDKMRVPTGPKYHFKSEKWFRGKVRSPPPPHSSVLLAKIGSLWSPPRSLWFPTRNSLKCGMSPSEPRDGILSSSALKHNIFIWGISFSLGYFSLSFS